VPLTPEQRKLCDANGDRIYNGRAYEARRARLIERAGDKCEFCRVPNYKTVRRAHGGSWKHGDHWYSPDGLPPRAWRKVRTVRIVLTLAHLWHDPQRNADDELAMLCQWCHFHHDTGQHKQTRIAHKDARRPLFAALEAA
jgi:hypothetical protein